MADIEGSKFFLFSTIKTKKKIKFVSNDIGSVEHLFILIQTRKSYFNVVKLHYLVSVTFK